MLTVYHGSTYSFLGSLTHMEYMIRSLVEYLLRNCFKGSISARHGGHHLAQKSK